MMRVGYLRISTGGLTKWIRGTTPEKAFLIFLKKYKPKRLGVLIEVYGQSIDYPDHLAYASTEQLLKKLGLWA